MNTSNFVCIKVLLKITIALSLAIGVSKKGVGFYLRSKSAERKKVVSFLRRRGDTRVTADNTWPFAIEGNLAFSIL